MLATVFLTGRAFIGLNNIPNDNNLLLSHDIFSTAGIKRVEN